MYILIIFLIILLLGISLEYLINPDHPLFIAIIFIGLIVSVPMLIAIPFSQYQDQKFIVQVNTTKYSIANSRKSEISALERVELQQIIIETNNQIASLKYDNKNQWDWWTNDIIDTVQYLK